MAWIITTCILVYDHEFPHNISLQSIVHVGSKLPVLSTGLLVTSVSILSIDKCENCIQIGAIVFVPQLDT